MSSSDETGNSSATDGRRVLDWEPATLTATVERYEDQPDECTLYPPGASDEEVVTRWITALDGSFHDLAEAR